VHKYIFSACISLLLALYFKPATIAMMKKYKFITTNYSGRTVVNGGGLAFLFPCLLGILPFWKKDMNMDLLLYINIVILSLLLGIIDDFLGEKHVKGFKGHLKMLFKGQLTTGILKILIGIIAGFIASSFLYSTLSDIVFHTILFALCINLINLMDLRPGRAIKVFMIISVLITIFIGFNNIWILLPTIIGIIIYIPGEMKEEYMLGDTGSNLLGGVLGLFIISASQGYIKLTAFFVFVLIQIIGEFYSLSEIINAVPLFRSIDSIGRLKRER